MLDAVLLLLSGLAISTISMAVGIGGGILWAPLLILIYGLAPVEAVTYSLIIQVFGLGSGTFSYYRSGKTDLKLSLLLAAIALPGVIIGSFGTHYIDESKLRLILGIMAMMLALMFVARNTEAEQTMERNYQLRQVKPLLPIPGIFGFIMGLLSLGIGEWLIPALRDRLRLSMSSAVGIVVPMMLILAMVSSLIHINSIDNLHLDYVIWASLGTVAGAPIGARMSRVINDRLLKEAFIFIMTLLSVHFVFRSF
ncbi:MAG: sulfite exporter TauE/SafE family protein [Pseudomonadota bacterium]